VSTERVKVSKLSSVCFATMGNAGKVLTMYNGGVIEAVQIGTA
jgi:hypothetical protein